MARRLTARRLVLGACNALGLVALWRYRHRHALVILTVHGVMDEAVNREWVPLRQRLAPRRLDECLSTLRRYYRFISLDDAIEMLGGRRPLQPRSMVLTFDDGYRNHLTQAAPVLEKHQVPATVFVSTGFVDARRSFWFDRLDFALQRAAGAVRQVTFAGQPMQIDGRSRSTLAESYAAIRAVARALPDDRQMVAALDALAASLERENGERLDDRLEGDPWTSVLGAQEIADAPPLIGFGSHTVDHARIGLLPRGEVEYQLRASKEALERWTGRPCRVFCYPDGACSHEAAELVEAAHYDAAVTTERGLNRRGDDPMRLKRIDLPASGSTAELVAEVSGFFDWMLAVRKRMRRG